MQELLDRIKERNFGKIVEFRGYTGNKPEDLQLVSAGIYVRSVFVNGQDLGVCVYGFNLGRKPERYPKDHERAGDYNDDAEVDNIITKLIRQKYA